jgi:hypothetical protein
MTTDCLDLDMRCLFHCSCRGFNFEQAERNEPRSTVPTRPQQGTPRRDSQGWIQANAVNCYSHWVRDGAHVSPFISI